MKRKIVQHGCSSLTITLPHAWITKFGIKKGDELELTEQGNIIIISTKQGSGQSRKSIDTTEFGFFNKNNLSHLYQLGYDDIEIKFDNDKILNEIKARVPECIGFEIIDQKGNKVYVKSIANALESDFDIMLRKVFLITKEMGTDVLEAIKSKNYKKLNELRNLEHINNKFSMFCARILAKKGYKEPERICQIYSMVKGLEKIADEYKYICDLLSEYRKPIDRKIITFFEEANNYYNLFYEIFYKFGSEKKELVYRGRKELIKKGSDLLKNSKAEESLLLHNLLNVITKAYDACGEYFALIL